MCVSLRAIDETNRLITTQRKKNKKQHPPPDVVASFPSGFVHHWWSHLREKACKQDPNGIRCLRIVYSTHHKRRGEIRSGGVQLQTTR